MSPGMDSAQGQTLGGLEEVVRWVLQEKIGCLASSSLLDRCGGDRYPVSAPVKIRVSRCRAICGLLGTHEVWLGYLCHCQERPEEGLVTCGPPFQPLKPQRRPWQVGHSCFGGCLPLFLCSFIGARRHTGQYGLGACFRIASEGSSWACCTALASGALGTLGASS